jgi:hypothetical protein
VFNFFNIGKICQTFKKPLKLKNNTNLAKFEQVVEQIWQSLLKLAFISK